MAALNAGRAAGAAFGGIVAGLALSEVMLAGEKLSGTPSELIELERKTAAKLGAATRQGDTRATVAEQLITHGGHLALSAVVGVAYAALTDEGGDRPAAGAVFGAGFFIAAYGLVGPALGVTPLPWHQPPVRAVQHPVVHVAFGLAMAHFARRATQRGDDHRLVPA